MMDSDDDDIYPEYQPPEGNQGDQGNQEMRMNEYEDGEEEGEEVEDDSDDEVNFIIDSKELPKQDTGSQQKRQPATLSTPSDLRKATVTPQPGVRAGSTPLVKAESQPPDDRPGTDFPPRHTSKLDPNGNPVHPATGKPILSTDFDVDFPSESTKPWRKPGADVTDYFNYGFDEFTWASYCLKQEQMPKEIKEINAQAEQMKAFVEGIPGGMPGMPGIPTGPAANTAGSGATAAAGGVAVGGMPQMMGVPGEAEMQQMLQTMMSQGMDPSAMDPNQFMQMMMGNEAGGMMGQTQPPSGPQAGFAGGGGGGGFGGGGGGGGGGRGRGRGGRRNW